MAILKDLIVNGAARIIGDAYLAKITASLFIKEGGTSSQFLKADGSVDSNTYVTANTASAVDNILDGSNSGTAITYAPYSTQQSKLSFDTSNSNPNRTDRLNLNGYLYATKLYSGGKEVLPLSAGDSSKLTGTLYSQDIYPKTSYTYDLGSSDLVWKNIYARSLFLTNNSFTYSDSNTTYTSDFCILTIPYTNHNNESKLTWSVYSYEGIYYPLTFGASTPGTNNTLFFTGQREYSGADNSFYWGINIKNPQYTLHVNGTVGATTFYGNLSGNASTADQIKVHCSINTYDVNNKWHKFAYTPTVAENSYCRAILLIQRTYSKRKFGILRIWLRMQGSSLNLLNSADSGAVWLVRGDEFPLTDIKICTNNIYDSSTEKSTMLSDIYIKPGTWAGTQIQILYNSGWTILGTTEAGTGNYANVTEQNVYSSIPSYMFDTYNSQTGTVVHNDGVKNSEDSGVVKNAESATYVTQTAVTASSYTNWRTIPFGGSNSNTEGFTPTTVNGTNAPLYTTDTLTFQPSTGTVRASKFKGNLDGTANIAKYLTKDTRMDYGWDGINYFNISAANQNAAKVNDTPYTSATWTHILRFNHNNNAGYYTDLAIPFNANTIYYKRIGNGSLQNNTTNGGWVAVLDALNYTSYTVKKDGTGASGTWGISISGNAVTATYASNTPLLSQTSISSLSSFTHTTNLIYAAAGGNNSVTDKPTGVDAFGVLNFKTADGWYGQLLMSANVASGIYWRTAMSLSGGWKTLLDSSNYTSYTVSLSTTQTISGNKTFSGSTTLDSATIGNLIVNGAATFNLTITGNISGNATNVTGTVAIGNGGTGATTAAGARDNLSTFALVVEGSYPALIQSDGTTNNWIKIGTANNSYGLLPSLAGSAGSGHNYLGTSSWYWKYAYIDNIYGSLNGNATSASSLKTVGRQNANSTESSYVAGPSFAANISGGSNYPTSTGSALRMSRGSQSNITDGYSPSIWEFFVPLSANSLYFRNSWNSSAAISSWSTWNKVILEPTNSYATFELVPRIGSTMYLVSAPLNSSNILSIGNSTTPVYIDSDGVVTACTSYANASVNSATNANNIKWTTNSNSNNYPLAFCANTSPTSNNNYGVNYNTNLTYNPDTNTLTAGTFNGTASKVTTTADTANALYLIGVNSGSTNTLKRDTNITISNGVVTLFGIENNSEKGLYWKTSTSDTSLKTLINVAMASTGNAISSINIGTNFPEFVPLNIHGNATFKNPVAYNTKQITLSGSNYIYTLFGTASIGNSDDSGLYSQYVVYTNLFATVYFVLGEGNDSTKLPWPGTNVKLYIQGKVGSVCGVRLLSICGGSGASSKITTITDMRTGNTNTSTITMNNRTYAYLDLLSDTPSTALIVDLVWTDTSNCRVFLQKLPPE